MRKNYGERVFQAFLWLLVGFFSLLVLLPVWNIVVLSLNDANDAAKGGVTLWPRAFSLENYKVVFQYPQIFNSFWISISKTFLGVTTHVLFCSMVAYAMSKKHLMGRQWFIRLGIVTMFFGGGLIPSFLLMKSLGLLDNYLIYIIPAVFSFYDMIILMNFFREIPDSLEESAAIDGASTYYIFWRIILPLSMPVLATIALFNGVGQWNDYMTAKIYINNPDLHPVQMFLYKIIVQEEASKLNHAASVIVMPTTARSLQLATMVITTAPIVMVYPFLQKYFVKGMMVGSVKG
ncbi:MAG: carbohydrate ABC transporter permease [Spirochaetales bacterium]